MKKKTSMKESSNIETGFLVPFIENILKILAWTSAHRWIVSLMRKSNKWAHDEKTPFWFTEVYVLSFLLILGTLYWFVPLGSSYWFICLAIACYRLFDIAQGLASIVIFEPKLRHDEQGGYILARNPTRWLLLTLLNLGEIVLYFSFIYMTAGNLFSPIIATRISAVFQSVSVFIAGSGALPENDLSKAIVTAHLIYFVFFLILIAPMVFSLIRAKEKTTEILGKTDKSVK